jgi:hypothetical protein
MARKPEAPVLLVALHLVGNESFLKKLEEQRYAGQIEK